jgi:hypothetical protein
MLDKTNDDKQALQSRDETSKMANTHGINEFNGQDKN